MSETPQTDQKPQFGLSLYCSSSTMLMISSKKLHTFDRLIPLCTLNNNSPFITSSIFRSLRDEV